MSDIEYNSLIFQVSRRLDQLNEPEQLLFMCRNRLPSGNEEGFQNSLTLLKTLEQRQHLGPDNMEAMKDVLKGLNEWSLLGKVEKFERKRKEYKDLIEQITRILDELNDLERVMSKCRGRIPQESECNIIDVRSLFEALESNSLLGINRLGILKQILIDLEQADLVKEVDEFEKRRHQDEEYESRKAQAAAIVSTCSERIIGEVRVHCTFRKLSGALLVVGTGLILRRCSSLEEFAEAFTVAVLPAANALRAISEGSVCFTIRAENRPALEALWARYQDGTLQKDLQHFLLTDEIIQLAHGEEVTVFAYIDEQEFRNTLVDLKDVERQVLVIPDVQESEWPMKVQRRNSDSSLYCKAQLSERPVLSEKPTIKQTKYLDQERLAVVESYLERAEDTRSMTTETSDSGMPGTHNAPSEHGVDETSGQRLLLKDVSERLIMELTNRLQSDPVSLVQFCRSFGIDHNEMPYSRALENMSMSFPDTPVKMLTDVLKVLQMYDLVDLLEKAKPRTLRPALPLRDMGQLLNPNNRETTFYSKAAVLILDTDETRPAHGVVEGICNFFKGVSPESEIESVSPGLELLNRWKDLKEKWVWYRYMEKKFSERRKKEIERELEEIKQQSEFHREIEEKDVYRKKEVGSGTAFGKSPSLWQRHLLEKERVLKTELTISAEEKKKIKDEIEKIKRDVKIKNKNLAADADQVLDKWIQQKDKQSTLFVIVEISSGGEAHKVIADLIRRKLPLLSNETKLLITLSSAAWETRGKIPESLHVMHDGTSPVVTTMLEVLSKRWQTLDIISVMREVQRTLSLDPDRHRLGSAFVVMNDSLSSLPRLRKTKQEK